MLKHFHIASVVLIFLCSLSNAQVKEEWVKSFKETGFGRGSAEAKSIAVDRNGNVYVTGTSDLHTLMKYNSSGAEQWSKKYQGSGNPRSIAIDGEGNVYFFGSDWVSGTEPVRVGENYTVTKFNPSGKAIWRGGYTGRAETESIILDGEGNVCITGVAGRYTSGGTIITMKYSAKGDSQWVTNCRKSKSDDVQSMAVDSKGNIYLTGRTYTFETNYDYFAVKYNSSGAEQWYVTYNSPGNDNDKATEDVASSIAVDGSGNVYVTGVSYGGRETGKDYVTIKYNSAGAEQWVRRYNGPGSGADAAVSMVLDAAGNIYVTGTSYGNLTMNDYATIKYNSDGDSVWVRRFGGDNEDIAVAMTIDGGGNIYVTGYSLENGKNNDIATVKYNPAGDLIWVTKYDGKENAQDIPVSITLDASQNVYLAGYSLSNGSSGYTIIKYSQLKK